MQNVYIHIVGPFSFTISSIFDENTSFPSPGCCSIWLIFPLFHSVCSILFYLSHFNTLISVYFKIAVKSGRALWQISIRPGICHFLLYDSILSKKWPQLIIIYSLFITMTFNHCFIALSDTVKDIQVLNNHTHLINFLIDFFFFKWVSSNKIFHQCDPAVNCMIKI